MTTKTTFELLPSFTGVVQTPTFSTDELAVLKAAFPEAQYLKQKWNRGILELAAECERDVRFEYPSGGGVTDRYLSPEAIVTTQSGNEVVVGLDEEKYVPRSFRLDRIVGYVSA